MTPQIASAMSGSARGGPARHPSACHDAQRDIGVGAGMVAVGHKGRALEAPTGTGANEGRDPVAREAERPSRRERHQVLDVAGRDQSVDCLVAGHAGADEDRRTTASPAQRSALALRSAKAIPSGIAVAASPVLWIRSASRATLPEAAKTTAWTPAVSASTSNAKARREGRRASA